jgi:hypothetical protein
MTVVEGWFAGKKYNKPPRKSDLPGEVGDEIIKNICLNSKAFYIEELGKKTEFIGNRTECALLMLAQNNLGVPYDGVRRQHEAAVKEVRHGCCTVVHFLPAMPRHCVGMDHVKCGLRTRRVIAAALWDCVAVKV